MNGTHPPRIVIAGAGIGGLEAAIALREQAGEIVDIELLSPESSFVYRAMAIAAPFGYTRAATLPLSALWQSHRIHRRAGRLTGIEMDGRRLRLASGEAITCDALVIAVGARPHAWRADAVTFGGPASVPAIRDVLRRLERGLVDSVTFVAPPGATWTLPLYELAMLTAAWCADHHVSGVTLSVASAEHAPLEVFGPAASAAVRQLLADRGIALVHDEPAADVVITMPELLPPDIEGLPAGFIEVDDYGRVDGLSRVYAIGDAANHAVKQGGLAAQQADVAAAVLAHDLDLGPAPDPYDPVLRGLLLTGMTPAYLRNAGHGEAIATFDALWWPPSKVAGRLLGPFLAGVPTLGGPATLQDRPAPADAQRAARDREELRGLAMEMAEGDARLGDFRSALRWLQTVEWLDGALTDDLGRLRSRWQAEASGAASR